MSPDGRSVYVANGGSDTVSQYDVGPGGVLSPKSPATVAAGAVPNGVAVSPDGRSAYVPNGLSDTISQYDVSAGGALTPKNPATVATAAGPSGAAMSPDGRSLYFVAAGSVSQDDIGPGGLLSPKTPATVATGGTPSEVVVTPLPRIPTSNEQCMNNGWRTFPQFKNQGQCIAFVNQGP